jgi:energy-coupling factor transport system ATP-binding protein
VVIRFDDVTVTYDGETTPALAHVTMAIDEGELVLVAGRTGSGKSTLLGAVNGLVPHFTGGHLAGRVTVAGADTRLSRPRDLAALVGVVRQDPSSGFVTDTVEAELAYTMEQLALPHDVMRRRVEDTLDLLGLAELRSRPLRDLSGGQQQRVAIGAVLTAHPRVLVLDEPTSALDPTAAEEVLAAVTRLVHDLGITAVVAEHRLERVVQYADRVVLLHGDGRADIGAPADVMRASPVAPPIVELARLAGWEPVPLSVRDARRRAPALRERLGALPSTQARTPRALEGSSTPALVARSVLVRYRTKVAVRNVDVALHEGEVAALMGRNGCGKSSLLWALQGSGPRQGGTVDVHGHDPGKLDAAAARRLVGLVPQNAGDLLYLTSVDEECRQADAESQRASGTTRSLLDSLVSGLPGDRHPRDLSEGQRLALVLAIQLAAAPEVVLLDEPTRGLDYPAKAQFTAMVRNLAEDGRAVLVATHDVELAAGLADRVLVMAEGELVADGPATEVLTASPGFAPQVARILSPQHWLTVDEVRRALAGAPA